MSVIALLYIALQSLLVKQYTAKSIYYGWLIILFGLLIPFRPHFRISLIEIDPTVVDYASTPIVNTKMDYAASTIMGHTRVINHSFQIQWFQIAFWVWLAGFALMMFYHIWRHVQFMKLINRWSEDIGSTQIVSLVEALKADMHITGKIHIKMCPCISTPMLVGFYSPTILLPLNNLSDTGIPLVLRHELIHYKQKDVLFKTCILTATGIHWFNPMVYVIAKYINRQCEISCDEGVVHYLNMDSRKLYAETIINASRKQPRLQTALSTNFNGGKNTMKNRIILIMNTKNKRLGLLILCLIFVATITTGKVFATNHSDIKDGTIGNKTTVPEQSNIAFEQNNGTTIKKDIDIYEKYGLTYDEDQDMFFYNGKTVKYFYDQLNDKSSYYFIMRPKGEISLKALRDKANELTGITVISNTEADKFSGQFFGESNHNQATVQENKSMDDRDTEKNPDELRTDKIAKDCSPYKEYGLTYDKDKDMLYYKGEAVKSFFDKVDVNSYFFITRPTGSIYVKALRNEEGELMGIDYVSVEEYDQLFSPAK